MKSISLARIAFASAMICVVMAIAVKMLLFGTVLPTASPIIWIKLADTALLFAIAAALVGKQ